MFLYCVLLYPTEPVAHRRTLSEESMKGKSLFVAVMFESRIYNMISHQHCLLAAIVTSSSLLFWTSSMCLYERCTLTDAGISSHVDTRVRLGIMLHSFFST